MRRLLMAVLFFMVFLLWTTPMVIAQFEEAKVEKLRVSIDAPDLTLKELSGGKVSLKELRGKIILLNFFATCDQTARGSLPLLLNFMRRLRTQIWSFSKWRRKRKRRI